MQVQSLGQEDPLEVGMATHSSILAWKIPWTEEPGRLQSIESQRVGHDWSNLARMLKSHGRWSHQRQWGSWVPSSGQYSRCSMINSPTSPPTHGNNDDPDPSQWGRESFTDNPDAKPCGWRGKGNETGTPWKATEGGVEESWEGKGQLGDWGLKDTSDFL